MFSFVSDPSFAVALAFCIFVGLGGRTLWKSLQEGLANHKANIQGDFEEAQGLLEEARALLSRTEDQHTAQLLQEQKILELARMEVDFMEVDLRKDLEAEAKSAEILYQQHVQSILQKGRESYLESFMAGMVSGVEEVVSTASSENSRELALSIVKKLDLTDPKYGG